MLKGKVVIVSLLGALALHSATAAAAANNPQQANCQRECEKFYSHHTNQFEEINESWGSCVHGCEFFSRLGDQVPDQPINTLKNCNYSCDERYGRGGDVQACEAGCGFSFNEANRPQPSLSPRIETPPSLGLPGLFNRINQAMPQLNRIVQSAFSNPFDQEYEFNMPSMSNMPSMPSLSSMPSISFAMPRGMFGRKDSEETDHIFDDLFTSMNSMMKSLPALPRMERLDSFSPFSMFGGQHGGKMTVINSGPGFTEEKHYNILPGGKLVEIPMEKSDEMHHANPLDEHFDEYDVEVFDPTLHQSINPTLPNQMIDAEVEYIHPEVELVKPVEDPVEDVSNAVDEFGVSGSEVAEPQIGGEETKSAKEEENPFLSVIRNSIQESERLKEELFKKYRSFKDAEYRDNNTCGSEHLRWSDWVACVHMRMGVPRWLTAATIAFGVIFSVWLCFVIPSAAPKQRISNLVMRIEKLSPPTAALSESAKAKEAEANASTNASKEPVIAIIKVDMPPSYGDVAPGSPAPSYKSDMVAPGSPAPSYKSDMVPPASPAPSYKSVDAPAKTEDTLEPTHKKNESIA